MANKEMADYFASTSVADYTATELQLSPQGVLVEQHDKNQIIHEADDGTILVTTVSGSTPIFNVTLQWHAISESDAGTIVDFWNDENKANGRARTFYWQHPTDGHTYVARFLSQLERSMYGLPSGHQAISQVTLRIEGRKAA